MTQRRLRRRALVTLLTAAAVLVPAACNLPSGVKSDEQSKEVLFSDRPNRQEEDYDRNIGESVEVLPYEATLTSAEFVAELGPNEKSGYIVARVSVTNVGTGKRENNRFHWQLLTPGGELKNFALVEGGDKPLEEKDLQKDESVAGPLIFTAGGEKGNFYIVFAPQKGKTEPRGVWGPITVA